MNPSLSETRREKPPYRAAAIEHHRKPSVEEGRPLRVTPPWLGAVYRALMVGGLGAFLLVGVVPLSEYASGVAVVRLAARSEVHADSSGIVEEILVSPGDSVAAGAVLARLEGSRPEAELEKLRRQYEHLLIDRLRSPRGQASSGLGTIHEEMKLAEKNLERLEVRAPMAGIVGDVLVRVGKAVEPGQHAFTVLAPEGEGEPTVIGLLPGRYRPLLEPGMEVQLRWSSYREARQELTIEHVSAGVVGAADVRALAGPTVPGLTEGSGYAVVQARLSSPHFEAGGERYQISDGLLGSAEVAVRKRRVASLLLPWTDKIGEGR